MRCRCAKESDTDCPLCKTSKQEVRFAVCLPKAVKQQLSMKQHSIAVAWWAIIEVLSGRVDQKTNQLKQLNCLDWPRQEGVMAEALCTYAPNATNFTRFPEPKELAPRGGLKFGG